MSGLSISQARRALQLALGALWLLDAALQLQPFMFGRGFALEILKPTTAGNPWVVARPALWSAAVVLAHPWVWNTLFALTQFLLALGLFWRRTVKLALAGTVVWSLIVWWLGEGFGGILAGSASPLMGAPGAVSLYALLALLLWPCAGQGGRSIAATSILHRASSLAWLLVWAGDAYLALLPANDSPAALHGMLAGMTAGEPRPLASLDRLLAGLVERHSTIGPAFGVLFALCALAVCAPTGLARPLYRLAMILAAIAWVGQDFGGILTGRGTDPNSGPLLFLLALAYWPIVPTAGRAPVGDRRCGIPLRLAAAFAAVALVGASSVAAATGLTNAAAPGLPGKGELTFSSRRIFGPGSIRAHFAFAGYRILFGDSVNQSTPSGLVGIELSYRGRPLEHAQVSVTFHSLSMPMPTRRITLAGHGEGGYRRGAPFLGMDGCWRVTVGVDPDHAAAFRLVLKDLVADGNLTPGKRHLIELMTRCHS